jgi:hypothetical protein
MLMLLTSGLHYYHHLYSEEMYEDTSVMKLENFMEKKLKFAYIKTGKKGS